MKQVIDGRTYNTDTATEIGYASSNCGPSDFRHYEETLMKTPRGRFFLSGEGGPMTRWAKGNPRDGYWGSKGLRAISTDEALYWCEQHNVDADVIAEHFDIEEA